MIIANLDYNYAKKSGSANKNRLLYMIEEAAVMGATHISFPMFTADGLYREKHMQDNYRGLMVPESWMPEIARAAKENNIGLIPVPLGAEMVDVCNEYTDTMYVHSWEITNIPLLHKVSATGKPILLATAGATIKEIETALELLRPGDEFPTDVTLLHAHVRTVKADRFDLRAMLDKVGAFTFDIGTYRMLSYGFSSQCEDPVLCATPALLGADVIEAKLDMNDKAGFASEGSLTSVQFRDMVVKVVEFKQASRVTELDREDKKRVANLRRSEEDWLRGPA